MSIARQARPSTARHVLAELSRVRWQPDRHTVVALGSYVLVVAALYLAFQVFTTAQVALNFITYGPVTLLGLGVALPILYTTLRLRRSIADVGLTTRHLLVSLALGLLFGLITYQGTIATLNVAPTRELVPLVSMALAVTFFEAVFFRGWLQLRLEAAFGLLPGLVLAALLYSLYHVGYGMTPDELLTLFILGLTFSAAFRLTKNVLVLWPFYTSTGSLYNALLEGRALPFEATFGFVIVLVLMAVLVVLGARLKGSRAD